MGTNRIQAALGMAVLAATTAVQADQPPIDRTVLPVQEPEPQPVAKGIGIGAETRFTGRIDKITLELL